MSSRQTPTRVDLGQGSGIDLTAVDRSDSFDALASVARSGFAWVLATLRSDFYSRCEELPELMALKEGPGQYHLPSPSRAEVSQMIRQPARAAGLTFEQETATGARLDDELRDAAAQQLGDLPLLEFALEELYQRRTADGELTFAAYREIGGVEGALSRRTEAAFSELAPDAQQALPEVLRILTRVRPGDDETVSRTQAPLEAFGSPQSRALMEAFVAARLLVADRGPAGESAVSIAHEALLHCWPRCRDWLDANRDLLRARGPLSSAARLWAEKGRPRDLLLGEGKPLEETLPLLTAGGLDLTQDERGLLEASVARASARRRARRLMNANGAALLVAGAAVVTFWLWKIVPTFAHAYAERDLLLPISTRATIAAANFTLRWILPFAALAAPALYVLRRRIRLPDFVDSGMALAVASGVTLLGLLVVFAAAFYDVARLL